MKVVSDTLFNVLGENPFLKINDPVLVRINLAFFNSKKEVGDRIEYLMSDSFPFYGIMLDYPNGRRKPPTTKLSVSDAIDIANRVGQTTNMFFALSNTESIHSVGLLRDRLDRQIELIPKIETVFGVKHSGELFRTTRACYAMLDKEDLFFDCCRIGVNQEKLYRKSIDLFIGACKKQEVKSLMLQGVIFST